ncbi:cupin domain-containing protein [Coralliovum pocilloporae]|uniref:cupin domain-containing protein n=1 Tax=Coralliovum pocilloporae TaxID=3066369 RepID=UPI00330731DF
MKLIDPQDFTGDFAWHALDIAEIDNATVRLHWTNEPYIWHVNDGPEVFVVLSGAVDMHVRDGEQERVLAMSPGQIFHAEPGDEHVAHPRGDARILVIEQAGSL